MNGIPNYTEVAQVLMDMVAQHCRDGDQLQDYGLIANDLALNLLERLGLVVKVGKGYKFTREGQIYPGGRSKGETHPI